MAYHTTAEKSIFMELKLLNMTAMESMGGGSFLSNQSVRR